MKVEKRKSKHKINIRSTKKKSRNLSQTNGQNIHIMVIDQRNPPKKDQTSILNSIWERDVSIILYLCLLARPTDKNF